MEHVGLLWYGLNFTNYTKGDAMKVSELIEKLECYHLNDEILASIWHPMDIEQQAGHTLGIKELEDVISLIECTHDASIGINWDVIQNAIDQCEEDANIDER